MNNLLKWPADSGMCGLIAYYKGWAAWFADRPYNGLQSIQWRRGWQDAEDLVIGMSAYDAGRPFDRKRPRSWCEGWEYAAESASH
jgi:hypothetical protein